MEKINNIIPQVIQGISERKPGAEEKLKRAWERMIADKELKKTHIVGVKDGNILVYVDSPARLFHMNMKKKKILATLQEEMPEIKTISFKIGKEK